MKKRIGKGLIEGAKRQADLVFSTAKLVKDLEEGLDSVAFLNKPKEDRKNRLVKLGLLILASPDPFTDPLAYALILAGLIKDKIKAPTIHDLPIEFRQPVEELLNMKKELQNLKI